MAPRNGPSTDRLTGAERRALGAWYTPEALASFAVAWAVQGKDDRVLDPGCGDAVFLVEGARRLAALGRECLDGHLSGIDLNRDALGVAEQALAAVGAANANLTHSSFFEVQAAPFFDAVVGNPPYVRYQLFREENRAAGLSAAARGGVILPQLASAWAPYVIHATRFLKPGGRFAMVLPGELLHVGYAAAVRDFLLRSFKDLVLVAFEDKVFPGALEEVVLVLGEYGGTTNELRVLRLKSLDDLAPGPETLLAKAHARPIGAGERWLTALLQEDDVRRARAVVERAGFQPLSSYGRVDIGVVTGANDFFVITDEQAVARSLPRRVLVPAVSRAVHVQGTRFTTRDWKGLAASGDPAFLVVVDEPDARGAVEVYLAEGVAAGLPARYKCKTREPWYRVPYVRTPDLFLTYMSNIAPRLVANEARVTSTNTVHGVFVTDPVIADVLAVAFLNSATLLSAEIEGRSYGGGVLKLEPREAMKVLLPKMTPALARRLRELRGEIDALVREGRLDEASAKVDAVVLGKRVRRSEIEVVRAALASLRARRLARGRTAS